MVLKSRRTVKSEINSNPEESKKIASIDLRMNSKSPGRAKSPGRTKSPRRKSPTRTKVFPRAENRARSESPARNKRQIIKSPNRRKKNTSSPLLQSSGPKPRSPIRNSPSQKSLSTKVARNPSSDNFTKEMILRSRRSNANTADNLEVDNKAQIVQRGRTRRLEVQVEQLEINEAQNLEQVNLNSMKRITSRSFHDLEEERIVHLKHFDQVTNKIAEFSDDDMIHTSKSNALDKDNFEQIIEFGGSLGSLFLMFIMPLNVISLHIFCNEFNCSFLYLPDFSKYVSFYTYFDLSSFLVFVTYVTVLAILSIIPCGKKVVGLPDKQGKFVYTMNGFFSFIILSSIIIGLEIEGVHITEFVVEHIFHLIILSFLFGFFLSVYCYIRSFYVPFSALNIHVVGKRSIYGFFMGRELNPRIFNVFDLKIYMYRLTCIGTLILDYTYLYKHLRWTGTGCNQGIFNSECWNINPTLAVLVFFHSVYFLGGLMCETSWVTSFEIQYEGFGYMSGVGYMTFPFMASSVTRYISDYEVHLTTWELIFTTVVFTLGFLLLRGSNNQKDAFRKNPYDPALSHLETIPTTKGKKLICSGFWGIVRHPNYLGDILINLSFAPFVLNVPPIISIIASVSLLIHRCTRDNARCRQKYGAAWNRYCSKVKYVLIPKIY